MDTGLYIAARYLFARKSHNVINVISAISAIGMAIGTAALILILSVYNGFDRIIEDNMSDLDPDILVTSAEGSRFVPRQETMDALAGDGRISSISCVLQENVFLSYGDRQGLAKAKGVDMTFGEQSPLNSHITTGEFALYLGDIPLATVGVSLAHDLGINPRFVEQLTLYFPKAGSRIPLMSPASALGSVKVAPAGLFSINSTVDAELVIIPIETMRELIGEEDTVSGLELRTAGGGQVKSLMQELPDILGPGFRIQDRYMQHPAIYKMMKYEKFAIFLILIFVVIIIAFNIFGSLSMLIIEKEEDMEALRAMGATGRLRKRIFILEGWMISLAGLVIGLVAGIGLTLLQQHFGLVKMPQGFFISAYPAILQLSDVLLTSAGVALTGLVISLIAATGNVRQRP